MRQVQIREEDEVLTSLADSAQAGETVTLVRGSVPVAQIIPFPKPELTEAERAGALEKLRAIMDHGYDLGGFKITSRDELYDRNIW